MLEECAGPLVSQGYNLIKAPCPVSGDTATNIVGKDPRLVRVKAKYPNSNVSYFIATLALHGDSLAIDAGNPAGCVDDRGAALTIDLRGAPRPVNGNGNNGTALRCDMGAYEFGGPLINTLNPASIMAGATAFTVTVNGQRFTTASVVRWNDVNRPTTFVSANQLTVELRAADRQKAGKATVTVYTSGGLGGYSNPKTFTITAP